MKGLTLWQPWASLIAIGAKQYETRSWPTSYRGLLAIHAAKVFKGGPRRLVFEEPFYSVLHKAGLADIPVPGLLGVERLPQGAVVAVATLASCHLCKGAFKPILEGSPHELAFGDFSPGRFAWVLHAIRPLREPIPCSGSQGLWTVPADVEAEIRRQLGAPHA